MKGNFMIFSTACLLGTLLAPPEVRAAGRGVYCIFHWDENPSLNIKGGDVKITKRVQKDVYETLIEAGTVKALLTLKYGGERCQFTHPKSIYFHRYFTPDYYGFQLNSKERHPTCAEINMTVTCHSVLGDDS